MVMHFKSLNCLVIFDNRVKRSLFQLLPITTEIVFRIRIEQEKEIFNIRDDLLELKVVPRTVELESFLLEFTHRIGSLLESICNLLVDLCWNEIIFRKDRFLKAIVLDHP
jgi:hypothetical protein